MDPNKIPDLVDFFVIENVSVNYIKVEKGFHLNLYHSLILFTISDQVIYKLQNSALVNNPTDWEDFYGKIILTWVYHSRILTNINEK